MALAFAQPVSAGKPETLVLKELEEEFPLAPGCDGFVVIHRHVFDLRITTYFNEAGDPTREVIHFLERLGTYINSATEEVVSGPVTPLKIVIDFEEGTVAYIGRPFHVTMPGRGVVIHGTGIVIFGPDGEIIHEGGPHELLHGEVSACDLFE